MKGQDHKINIIVLFFYKEKIMASKSNCCDNITEGVMVLIEVYL